MSSASRSNLPKDRAHYMVVIDGNNDGTLDTGIELPSVHDTLEKAIEAARVIARDDDLPSWIFKCIPVRHVWRKDIVVDTILCRPTQE